MVAIVIVVTSSISIAVSAHSFRLVLDFIVIFLHTLTHTYPYDIGHIIRHSIEKNKQFAWSLLATFIPILSDNFIFSLRNEYLRSKIKWFYVCNIMYGCYVSRLKDLVHMMVNNWPILLGILVIVILCWTKLK